MRDDQDDLDALVEALPPVDFTPVVLLLDYEVYCAMRGEDPDPELLGQSVYVDADGARLVD